MDNKFDIDFSKLEAVEVKSSTKTIFIALIIVIVLLLGIVLLLIIVDASKAIFNSDFSLDKIYAIIILLLILTLNLVALAYIVYKVESRQIAYTMEEKKANLALRNKLYEEAIMREIKNKDNAISNVQKYRDIEHLIKDLKRLRTAMNDDEREKMIDKTISNIETKISELKK